MFTKEELIALQFRESDFIQLCSIAQKFKKTAGSTAAAKSGTGLKLPSLAVPTNQSMATSPQGKLIGFLMNASNLSPWRMSVKPLLFVHLSFLATDAFTVPFQRVDFQFTPLDAERKILKGRFFNVEQCQQVSF